MQELAFQGIGVQAPFAFLKSLLDPEAGEVPDAIKHIAQSGTVHLACEVDSRRHGISSGSDVSFSAETPVEVGCIAKNLTSLLIAMAASEGLIRFEDCVGSFFPSSVGVDASLKVFHLLNQSHGLDGSSLTSIPYAKNSHVDAAVIWQELSKNPALSPPGTLFYNYGSTGFWLATAILERAYRAKFSTLIQEKILNLVAADANIREQHWCPASGGIRLSCNDLLKVSSLQLPNRDNCLSDHILELRDRFPIQLARWPYRGDAAHPGWFRFGSAFGMLGQGSGTSALIMISPAENAAIALTGRGLDVAHFAQGTLSGVLGGCGSVRAPRLLSQSERMCVNTTGVLGRYRKANLILDIERSSFGDILASVYRRQRDGLESLPFLSRVLLPAIDEVFYPTPPEPLAIPYVQFNGIDLDGKYQHAITGKHIFRRDEQ